MHNSNNLIRTRGYINGLWLEASSRKTFAVVNPATRATLAEVPDMDRVDAGRAIDAAHAALPAYRLLTAKERSHLV